MPMALNLELWLIINNSETFLPACDDFILNLSAFRPGGSLDRRVNCRRVPQPRWVGARRSTKGGGENRQRGKLAAFVLPYVQVGCACSRGLQAFAWEREPYAHARSPTRPTFPYESPGPSFYRRKDRVQVYNGGVAVC
jgi:hypothetical protein